MTFEPTQAYAQKMDAADTLSSYRNEFVINDPELIYLDGNSLGRLPILAQERIQNVITQEWGDQLITSWGTNWYEAPQRIGNKYARLLGAADGEIIISDSTSINLYKLVMAALTARPQRSKIISDTLNFPTDLYILQGCVRQFGNRHHIQLIDSQDDINIDPIKLIQAIDENTALVTLSAVTFKSSYLYNMAAITEYAHRMGALAIWDLSHAAGAVPIELNQWDIDMAVGCSYKYLNGGPGSPAYLYVHQSLQNELISPVWGWFGEQSPFNFDLNYQPAQGIRRFLCGTPPILSLSAIEPGIDMQLRAGKQPIREKSIALTNYLVALHDHFLAPLGFTLGSPRPAEQRGSHVSIRHEQAYQISQAMITEMKVIPDFREPDNLRLGIAPLYTTFTEIWQAVERIRQIIEQGKHNQYPADRKAVT